MNNRKVKINQIAYLNLKTYSKKDLPEEVEYLDTGNLTRNVISELQKYSIVDANLPSRAQRKAKKNTILYSTVRPNLEHYGFLENPPYNLIVSTGFTTIDTFDDTIDPKYLYYAITQKHLTNYLHTIATNNVSSYPSINPDDLGNLVLSVPENLLEQQRIASVLSSLDAKIELNNKINRELEAAAKTLYDYWFVQFNFPDKNGKPYKTNGGKMVWNEQLKREIPEGWEVSKLSDTLRILRGASPRPIDDYMSETGCPWIKISDATSINHWFIIGTKEYIKESGVKSSRELQPGTLILSNSASPAIPKIVQIRACVHDGWLIVDSYKNGLYNEFMLFYFENFRSKILNMGSGSIFKNLKTEYIKDLFIAIPPNNLLKKSQSIFDNIFKQVLANAMQNQHLSSLRDWLLPMLMNGQVTVQEAEERISMVAEQEVGYGK